MATKKKAKKAKRKGGKRSSVLAFGYGVYDPFRAPTRKVAKRKKRRLRSG